MQHSIRIRSLIRCSVIAVAAAACLAGEASAQEAPSAIRQTTGPDIIVTARKRQESVLNVPVVANVVTQEKIEKLQAVQLTDLPNLVPGLSFGRGSLTQGTLVALRGVGTLSGGAGVDQSVSLNIDGLSLGQALAFTSGLFDLERVEVLKGPQALFYGKSSPGGVIALRTADPADTFELTARAGYEFEARNTRGELILSGPVSDTLKLRLATMYSQQDGYFRNEAIAAPGTGAALPRYDRAPHARNLIMRGTALWNPSPQFDARLKMTYVRDRVTEPNTFQMTSCPQGVNAPAGIPFVGGGEDCRLDRIMRVTAMDPAAFPAITNNGQPFLNMDQKYGTLEMNYRTSDTITLDSTTGYYKLTAKSLTNSLQTSFAGTPFGSGSQLSRREFTQEFRLNSEFEGPLNFTAGLFYEDGRLVSNSQTFGNTTFSFLRPLIGDGQVAFDIKTYSIFGQMRWKPVDRLELAAGVRWTDEKRSEQAFNYLTDSSVPVAVPKISADNFSPEITLTYRPTDDLTLFAAYKKAFKSGSFNTALPPAGSDNSFGDEKVEGGELGLKSRLIDRQLMLNFAGYYYKYKGLQVGALVPREDGTPVNRVVNAGSARTYGIDFDAQFSPYAIERLSLNLAINWNDGKYITLNNVPCYGGQTIALGCNQLFNETTGLYTAQELSGTPDRKSVV